MAGKLTEKQRRFVEAYMGEACGNAGKAYKLAGYTASTDQVAYSEGYKLLRNPEIQRAIEALVGADPLVAGRVEIQHWLTKLVRGQGPPDAGARDKLRAAELLLRTRGELLERREERSESTVRYVVTTEDQYRG